MKEARFISINKERWKLYELEMQHELYRNPDELAHRYIQILDDLSYARTFFPQSATVDYLNALALKSHGQIYTNRREYWQRFATFFAIDLPLLFYKYRRFLLYSFIIFIISTFIGVLSATHDATFVRLILGDDYVNQTLENIDKGNPMGIYGSESAVYMFFRIVFNNIYFSFLTVVMGIFTTMGTAIYMFRTGVMLGAFETFFWQRGLLALSLRSVLLHGVIELSSIIVAGAAGWMIGNAILFPGTYKRLDALRMRGSDAVKIAFGLMPFFMVAGFIESFVTRYTRMPFIVSYSIIFATAMFIIWYVIIFPALLNKKISYGNIK